MVIENNQFINRHPSGASFSKPPDSLLELLDHQQDISMTIYLKTHRSYGEKLADPIVFKGLIKDLEVSLEGRCSPKEIKSLLAPFHELQKDIKFWDHNLDGLAIFATADYFNIFKLQRDVPNLAIVANSFHIKPLLRIFQTTDRYQVLALSGNKVKLFEGNRDVLDEIPVGGVPENSVEGLGEILAKKDELDKYERFFRDVDKSVLDTVSRVSGLPLFLVALPENQTNFRSISKNPFLMPEGVNINPDAISNEDLRKRIWDLAKPYYDARLEDLIEIYGDAESNDLGSDDISDVIKAAVEGKIETLLLESGRIIPGHINFETGSYEYGDLTNAETDDILDDIGECVLSKGGNIVMTPAHLMPSDKGLAAIYRF